MGFLDKELMIRIRETEYAQVESIVKGHPDLYDSTSHFIRCAIIKQIKNYRDKGD